MKRIVDAILFAAVLLATCAAMAHAQYVPIPDFTSGAGCSVLNPTACAAYKVRAAVNARLSGMAPISPLMAPYSFASLPAEVDGQILWCRDCIRARPCAGGGSGALVTGERGAWQCEAPGTLEQDVNANYHNVTNAATVQAENSGDTNPREQLKSGTGVQVSNGTAAPYTVVDENANVTGDVNGTINVKAPNFATMQDGAEGVGSTHDDYPAIQGAITAACGTGSQFTFSKPTVYLPATPYPGCYSISQPLDITCPNLVFKGAGGSGGELPTNVCAQFSGPALHIESYVSTGNPLLVSSVTRAWQASHAYPAPASGSTVEIKDSNGNTEVSLVNGTSGSTQPTWPTVQGTITTDGTASWALAVIGNSLATGTGSALDASDETTSGPVLNLSYEPALNPMTGLSAFTAEAYFVCADPKAGTGASYCRYFVGSEHGNPNNIAGAGAFRLGTTQLSNPMTLQASLNVGGTEYTLTGTTTVTLYKTHFEELSYDGANIRLFLDGNLEATQAATGTIRQSFYETVMTPSQGGGFNWPDQSFSGPGGPEYIDSIRLLNVADHTASYTAPTAKLTSNSNTLLLVNFPTAAPFGTVQAQSGAGPYANVYLPVVMSANQMGHEDIEDLQLCTSLVEAPGGGGGLFASGIVNSTFAHLSCAGADMAGIYLNNNDYEGRLIDVSSNAGSSSTVGRTVAGFVFGGQDGDNTYSDLFSSGTTSAIVQLGGSGIYTKPVFSDFGSGVYPFVFEGAQFNITHPFTDIEDSNTNFISNMYVAGSWAPGLISGGELDAPTNTSAAAITFDGGQPVIDDGTAFDSAGTIPTQLVDVLSSPATPNVIRDATMQSGTPLTNSGHANDVEQVPGNFGLGFDFVGTPTASMVEAFTTPFTMNVPANYATPASICTCGTDPSETDAYTIKCNGTSEGTFSLSTSCALTLPTNSPYTCAAGQRMEIDAPATVSGKDIACTVAFTR